MPACVAHPRSRGENLIGVAADLSAQGSSPLTRGKRGAARLAPWGRGLIPAHAGKTFHAELEMIQERAHPRSRGENSSAYFFVLAVSGSSPLTRGKLGQPQQVRHRQGLIPAHAGKTCPGRRPPGLSRAHPRSRGENAGAGQPAAFRGGSSPLTRGKPHSPSPCLGVCGLIPAHAGKTAGSDE